MLLKRALTKYQVTTGIRTQSLRPIVKRYGTGNHLNGGGGGVTSLMTRRLSWAIKFRSCIRRIRDTFSDVRPMSFLVNEVCSALFVIT